LNNKKPLTYTFGNSLFFSYSKLTPPGTYSTVPLKMLCSCVIVEDRDVCQFVENPLLLRKIKEEVGIQVAVAKAIGQYLTPYQRMKVASRTYSRVCHGFIGHGVCWQPSQCTMDTVRGVWVSPSGSYVGFHETAAAVGDNKENT
jgi:hypothetical protein